MKHAGFLASIAVGSFLFCGTALAQADKKVERAWKAKCASCHGQAGKGDTEKGQQMKIADMTSAEFQAKKDDELRNAILNGVKKEKGGVKQEMDAFKGDLTPEQVDAVIAYIRTFKK
jgi:mono/diheme cytochrome c family protein